MTIEFHCPHCQKLLRTPDDKAGVRAACPGCGEIVTIPEAPPQEEFAQFSEPSDDALPEPTGQETDLQSEANEPSDGPTKPCPMCGASIRVAATRCRFCGENLEAPLRFDLGTVLTRGWEMYVAQLGMCVVSVLPYLGFLILTSVGNNFIQLALLQVRIDPLAMAALLFGVQIVENVIMLALFLGAIRVALKVGRGETATPGDLLAGGRHVIRAIVASILLLVAMFLVAAVCLSPGIAMAIVKGMQPVTLLLLIPGGLVAMVLIIWINLQFFFYSFVLVDKDVGTIEALRQARALTSGHLLELFVLSIVWFGMGVVGILALCVGILFALPLSLVCQGVAYHLLTREHASETVADAGL
ncbi:MAG: hypothetical protein ACKV0T_19525 [Planctomycetales bacterium]